MKEKGCSQMGAVYKEVRNPAVLDWNRQAQGSRKKKGGHRHSTDVFGHTESCLAVGERTVASAWKSKKMGQNTCAQRGRRHTLCGSV